MRQGWKVDIAGAQSTIDGVAAAGTTMQDAALDVDAALRNTSYTSLGHTPGGT